MMSRIVTTSSAGADHHRGEDPEQGVVPVLAEERRASTPAMPSDRAHHREREQDRDERLACTSGYSWPPGRARRPRRGRCRARGHGRCRGRCPLPAGMPAIAAGSTGSSRPVSSSRPSAAARVGPVALAPDVGDLGLAVDRGERHEVDHRLVAARVGELDLGAVAQRVVRAGVDADAAQDAAALVDLVLLRGRAASA